MQNKYRMHKNFNVDHTKVLYADMIWAETVQDMMQLRDLWDINELSEKEISWPVELLFFI